MPDSNTNNNNTTTAPLAVELPPSLPVSRPAPAGVPQYGLEELALFRLWRRSEFVDTHGFQPPAFNPDFEIRPGSGMRIKRWYDTSVSHLPGSQVVAYQIAVVTRAGSPVLQTLEMTVDQARTLNLPGTVSYPKYDTWDGLRPTRSAFVFTAGIQIRNGMVPAWMLDPDLARNLAAEIGRDTRKTAEVREVRPSGATQHDYDLSDPRRLLTIAVEGLEVNAGQLFAMRSRAAGIGSPGKWSIIREPVNGVAVSKLVWTPAVMPTGDMDTGPECPVPVRSLEVGETLALGFGGTLVVRQMAAMPDAGGGQTAAAPAAGGLTQDQEIILRTTAMYTQRIWEAIDRGMQMAGAGAGETGR